MAWMQIILCRVVATRGSIVTRRRGILARSGIDRPWYASTGNWEARMDDAQMQVLHQFSLQVQQAFSRMTLYGETQSEAAQWLGIRSNRIAAEIFRVRHRYEDHPYESAGN